MATKTIRLFTKLFFLIFSTSVNEKQFFQETVFPYVFEINIARGVWFDKEWVYQSWITKVNAMAQLMKLGRSLYKQMF